MPREKRIDSCGTPATSDEKGGVAAPDIEAIVQSAVVAAMKTFETELRKLLGDKITEVSKRLSTAETRLDKAECQLFELENKLDNSLQTSSNDQLNDLSTELKSIREEVRQSIAMSNSNEQYSRRNNLRIKGLQLDNTTDARQSVVSFLNQKLHLQGVTVNDIEAAHPLPASTFNSQHQQAGTAAELSATQRNNSRPPIIVRFVNRHHRDMVIASRKKLKGTKFAISEDLTTLNAKTLNRLRNDERVQVSWSWNGKIHALLRDGRKITVRPFQSLDDLV